MFVSNSFLYNLYDYRLRKKKVLSKIAKSELQVLEKCSEETIVLLHHGETLLQGVTVMQGCLPLAQIMGNHLMHIDHRETLAFGRLHDVYTPVNIR